VEKGVAKYTRDKVADVTRALSGLMPNLRGPSERKRKLYAAIVGSVAIYGAPIWADALLESREALRIVRAIQRPIAIRVCAGYRTVSREAALLLARDPPFELVAEERARIYERCMRFRDRNEGPPLDEIKAIRLEERTAMQRRWIAMYDSRDVAGVRTRDAILPHIDEWMVRGWGGISFHMTQLLTGHGCFGKYLYRIGKEESPSCWHCSGECDSSEHTLEWCPAWGVQRAEMREAILIGPEISLPTLVGRICTDKTAWAAFVRFASRVMTAKEDAERVRRAGVSGPLAASSP